MTEVYIDKLAEVVINHSCCLQRGEVILIEAVDVPEEPVVALIRASKQAGGVPLVSLKCDRIIRELGLCHDVAGVKLMANCDRYSLAKAQAFVGIRAPKNICELAGLPAEKQQTLLEYYIRPVHWEQRNHHTKWVALRWPTPAMAQRAGMDTEAFEQFFFSACLVDYARLSVAMTPLVELMRKTDKVRIHGPGDTDLTFSIAGMPPRKDVGRHNIPDGEVSTAPVRDSVNGRIQFNVPSVYYGTYFDSIQLDLKQGRVVNARAVRPAELTALLDQDVGARYVGEFALGLNPRITRPMQDILFDEKMVGSLHLALGNAYPLCDNGNTSAIHWDLILSQTPENGGGEIYFDSNLVRRDGRFVPPELDGLNPENLS